MNVTVIIPAFNEAQTVARVVHAALAARVGEVVVVDDGSDDATSTVAVEAGARVVRHPENRGKGGAVASGLKHTTAEVVVLLDADLVGLTSEHVVALVDPVRRGEVDATVGVFHGPSLATTLASHLTVPWNGQRAFRRALLDGVDVRHAKFAVELMLNDAWDRRRARVRRVPLVGLTHVVKERKLGFTRGVARRAAMVAQLARYALRRR